MGVDKVVGFGHQFIKALLPPRPEGADSPAAQLGPRIMHGADAGSFQALRAKMEAEWTPQMMQVLDIDTPSLPIIWDADFLCGPRSASGEDSYVLCKINVSSVFAIPDEAPAAIAQLALSRFTEGSRIIAEVGGLTKARLISGGFEGGISRRTSAAGLSSRSPFIDDLAQQIVAGPGKILHLNNELGFTKCTRLTSIGEPKRLLRGGGTASGIISVASGWSFRDSRYSSA